LVSISTEHLYFGLCSARSRLDHSIADQIEIRLKHHKLIHSSDICKGFVLEEESLPASSKIFVKVLESLRLELSLLARCRRSIRALHHIGLH